MDEHLPPLFAFLDETGADLVHYETCSMFDSSSTTGSIGKAVRTGAGSIWCDRGSGRDGRPQMRRYQAFGSLFCAAGKTVFRLERHPLTSMHDADVTRHLAAQTA